MHRAALLVAKRLRLLDLVSMILFSTGYGVYLVKDWVNKKADF